MKLKRLDLLVLFAAIAVLQRLVFEQETNLSALGALALICGFGSRRWSVAILLPLATRFATDVVVSIHSGLELNAFALTMLAFVYLAYVFNSLLGMAIRDRSGWLWIAAPIVAASIFFLISNLGSWWSMYPHSLAGLRDCYLMGIPYARGTFIGDIAFAAVFFAAFHLLAAPNAAEGRIDASEANELQGASDTSGSS